MLKRPIILAFAAAVLAAAAFLAIPGTTTSIPTASEKTNTDWVDTGYWKTDYFIDYYGSYDWSKVKLADPATRQSIIDSIVPQLESLSPEHLARLAMQEDICVGEFSINCFGVPSSKLKNYIGWALGRHSRNIAARSAQAAERSAASADRANDIAKHANDIADRAKIYAGLSAAFALAGLILNLWKVFKPAPAVSKK